MNDKGKGNASQERREERDFPMENLIIGLEEQPDDEKVIEETSSGVRHSGTKRKLLPEMKNTNRSLRVMDDDDPPVFDFRRVPIRKPLIRNINQIDQPNPSSQGYPYLVQEKYLKDWEEIILLADSHTRATIREIVYRADLLCNLEKKLEEAKDPISQLLNFEKENSEIIENMSNDLESVSRKIERLKDYSRQVVRCHKNSLLYYARKVQQKAASDDDVKQPKQTEEQKESPVKEKETISTEEHREKK